MFPFCPGETPVPVTVGPWFALCPCLGCGDSSIHQSPPPTVTLALSPLYAIFIAVPAGVYLPCMSLLNVPLRYHMCHASCGDHPSSVPPGTLSPKGPSVSCLRTCPLRHPTADSAASAPVLAHRGRYVDFRARAFILPRLTPTPHPHRSLSYMYASCPRLYLPVSDYAIALE